MEQVIVNVSLADDEGVKYEGKEIKLQADFGHDIQIMNSVTTDSNGISSFIFYPECLGSANLQATFPANDDESLMNASAENTLFVGEKEWNDAPVLWRFSDAVLLDELVTLNGYGLKAEGMNNVVIKYVLHTTDAVPELPPINVGILEKVQTDSRDGYFLVTCLPENAEPAITTTLGDYGFILKGN